MASQDRLMLIIALAFLLIAGGLGFFLIGQEETTDLEETTFAMDDEVLPEDRVSRRNEVRPLRKADNERVVAVSEEKAPRVVVAAGEGKIVGRVVTGSEENETPVADALVTSQLYFPGGEQNFGLVAEHREEVRTDEDGQFSIGVPGHGAYRIAVTSSGFAPLLKKKVRAGAELTLRLEAGAGLRGRVLAMGDGEGVHGARLTLRRAKSTWSVSVVTDEEGNYTFDAAPAETLYLTTEHPEFVPRQDEEIALVAGDAVEREIKLDPGKKIHGRVINPQDVPVEAAVVRIDGRQTETDIQGEFEIGGLGPKSQNIQVIADGFLTHNARLNLSGSREEAEVEMKLSLGGTVRGTVMDDTGKPMPDVEVKIFESWGSDTMWESGETRFLTHTNEDGYFEITGFPARGWGGYRARAKKQGMADAFSDEIKIKDIKKPTDVRIIMGAGGKITGKVMDRDGNPVIGAKLTLNPNNVYEWSNAGRKSMRTQLSGDDGTYVFEKLAPKSYRIAVIAPGHASLYKSNLKIVGPAILDGIDFNLDGGETVTGTVKDEDEQPLANAWVTIHSKKSYGRAQTNEEGNYVVENVSEGPYTATATLDGFSRERKKDIYADAGRIDFELKRNGYVWGDVRDKETGDPIKTYRIELQARNARRNNAWRRVRSQWVNDPSGKFKIYAKDGEYKLVVRAKGYILLEKEGIRIDLTADAEEMSLKATPGGSIEGWIRDHQGRPLSGVAIYVRQNQSTGAKVNYFEDRGYSERDGYFFVDSLEAGTYEVAFVAWGRFPLHVEPYVNVMGGDLKLLDFTPKPAPLLSVMAKGEKDRGINGRIRLDHLDGRPVRMDYKSWNNGRARYDTDSHYNTRLRRGRMTTRDLPPGFYRATITAKGYRKVEREFELRVGETLDLDLKLERKGKKRKKKSTQ